MNFGLPNFDIRKDIVKLAGVTGQEVRNLAPPNQLKMAIIPTPEPSNPMLTTLLLNPESVTETKAANWIQHNIPGQSDPVMLWRNGSARTVTFTAKVTLDLAGNFTVEMGRDPDVWVLEIEPELSQISEITDGYNSAILSKLYNVSARLESSEQNNLSTRSYTRWEQSIQPQLDFYRGLLIPRTGSLSNQVRTPPLVRLYMGNILGAASYSANQDFILASYSFNITQTTPELLPTSADVTFTFIEYNDKSKSIKPKETPAVARNQASEANSIEIAPRVLGPTGGFNGIA
jgi:hypothetical protein